MNLTANRVDAETMAEINVTPFTDVLLVLLIIFVVLAALVAPSGFERSLPNACGACASHAPKHATVDVIVSPAGRIFVDERPVTEAGLYGALATVARRDAKTTVRFEADMTAPYRLVIRALDAAKNAGLQDVTFESDDG